MRPFIFVGVLLLSVTAPTASLSQDARITARLVAGNVYMLSNNVTALIGNDGVLLVKGQDGDERILAALRVLTDKPVRYVVETQCDELAPGMPHHAGATIVAHENVRKRFELHKCSNDNAVLPDLTFDSQITLHFDDEEVRVIRIPTGHSDNDAIVYFKKANVVATGDAFEPNLLMGYTKYAGGNVLGVAQELSRIVELVPNDARIIPGSGSEASMSDVRDAIKTLDQMREAVSAQIAQGKTLQQLKETDVLAPWKDKIGSPLNTDIFLKFFWDCLTGPPDPKFQL
jgi:glyoxylase-like metal-dependent hydrolase (beta-lactamase superfamily II)